MRSKLFVRFMQAAAGLVLASSAHAGLIDFTVAGANVSTSGVTVGSTVSVTPSSTLAGTTFSLDPGQSSQVFNFLDVTVSGTGIVGGLIDATLNFSSPTASAEGVFGGFAVILGWASGGVLSVLNDPGPIAFGNGGLFDVDFFGFSSSCLNCTTLKGNVTAKVTLLNAPTTSVPEPATLSLLGAGLVALGLTRRRRTQKQ